MFTVFSYYNRAKNKDSTVFTDSERSQMITSIFFLTEVFVLFPLAINIVYNENLTNRVFVNFFLKSIQERTESQQKISFYVNKSKFYSRVIFVVSLGLVPLAGLFFEMWDSKGTEKNLQALRNSGLMLIIFSVLFGFYLLFFNKMVSLFKLNFKKHSIYLVIFFWVILPIPYNTWFVCEASLIPATGSSIKSYYQSLTVYLGVVLIVTTSFVAILFNIYMFRIEYEKKVKYIAGKLKLDLSVYYVHSSLDIIRNWLEFFYLHKQDENEKEIKDGNPIFWWEYSGEDPKSFKKEIISKQNFEDLMKELDAKKKARAAYLKRKFRRRKPGCLERMCCMGSKKKEESEDVFQEELHNKTDQDLKKELEEIQEEEINEGFDETLEKQAERRNKIFRKLTKIIYRRSRELPLEDFKANMDKEKYFDMKMYFYRDEEVMKLPRQFGYRVTNDPDEMVKVYFEMRTHPYFAILRRNKGERNFFLLALYQAAASRSTLPNLGTSLNMSYFDFMFLARKIKLVNHMYHPKTEVNHRSTIFPRIFQYLNFLDFFYFFYFQEL